MSSAEEPAGGSLTERIRQSLQDDIVGGRLAPHEPIDDKAVAAAFGVSRTPVREALLLLAAQGLVEIAPRAGVRVSRPDAAELVALLEALAELEATCTRLAAQRLSAAQRRALLQANDQALSCAAADDRSGYAQANDAFHRTLHDGSGNPVLVRQLVATRHRLAAFRRRVMDSPGALQLSCDEHRAIVDAVQRGDADAAGDAMREHILRKGRTLADLVLVHARG